MARGFIAKSWKKRLSFLPVEESYRFDEKEKIFSVADGVTRDPAEILPDISKLWGKIKSILEYPRPSPAKAAADIFTETFEEVVKDHDRQNRDLKTLKAAFEEANKNIKAWNEKNLDEIDYLTNDFAGCVASGAFIVDDRLYAGYIADAGVALFSYDGHLLSWTEDEGPGVLDKHFWEDPLLKDLNWNNPEARRRIRSHYRNNTKEENSYGVLTGEKEALKYVRAFSAPILTSSFIMLYTDGLESVLKTEAFGQKIQDKDFDGLEKLCRKKVEYEGTLVSHLHLKLKKSPINLQK